MINQNKMTAVEWLVDKILTKDEKYDDYGNVIWYKLINSFTSSVDFSDYVEQAKEIEKEQKQRFNKFLNDEMELGISDKKTIERIHWYYNNYLLTFKSE